MKKTTENMGNSLSSHLEKFKTTIIWVIGGIGVCIVGCLLIKCTSCLHDIILCCASSKTSSPANKQMPTIYQKFKKQRRKKMKNKITKLARTKAANKTSLKRIKPSTRSSLPDKRVGELIGKYEAG
ncbi:U3 protein [Ekpoma virus 2]|uniref:U3 protein n=1 Tax=Ekpoma virus 2 TaxID=1987021 RepID=A0A0C5BZR0_9RHAB|nr:U3 protein [Ekpoma virus 2]AJN08924.1 U3 protein [Ekpoma virus 2]